jgi:hypothetical protein
VLVKRDATGKDFMEFTLDRFPARLDIILDRTDGANDSARITFYLGNPLSSTPATPSVKIAASSRLVLQSLAGCPKTDTIGYTGYGNVAMMGRESMA